MPQGKISIGCRQTMGPCTGASEGCRTGVAPRTAPGTDLTACPTATGRHAAAAPPQGSRRQGCPPRCPQQAPARLPGTVSRQDLLPALLRISEAAEKDRKKHQHRQRKGVEHPAGQPAAAQGQQREKHVQIPAGHEQHAAVARRVSPHVEGLSHGPDMVDALQCHTVIPGCSAARQAGSHHGSGKARSGRPEECGRESPRPEAYPPSSLPGSSPGPV